MSETLSAHFAPGRILGESEWLALPQPMLSAFEELTLSRDPLHMDPEWVRLHTHYAQTIAPGFLTMSLLPYLAAQVRLSPEGYVGINYGFDRLRWPAPIPVDSEVRARFVTRGAQARPLNQPGVIVSIDATIEVRNQERPGLVAQWLVAMLPDTAGDGTAK